MASLCVPPPALSSAACLRGGAPVRRVAAAAAARPAARGVLRVRAGNDNEGGVFAPIVVVARNVIGVKQFNQFRGKAISLHSQVITEFCKNIGADGKVRQGLIRLAKKNGGKLGFLA